MAGDPTVDVNELLSHLLSHGAWLRRLAASLVGGPDADDLVQETWIAAMQHPPAGDRPVRPWLAQVLRNVFRMRARGDGRRVRREEVDAGVATDRAEPPTPETLVARVEEQRLLARLVTELDEPFRATLLLRYFEGLTAAQIARVQRVPAGTVRWRLKTGLDRLRAALDATTDGDRKAWCALLVPLAQAGAKGVVMKKILGVTVALALLIAAIGLGVRFFARGHAAGAGAGANGASATAAAHAKPTPPAAGASGTQAAAASGEHADAPPIRLVAATVVKDETAIHGAFEGRIVDWASGQPVADAEVTFADRAATASVTSGADGRFAFTPAHVGPWSLAVVTKPGYLPFAPAFGASPIQLDAARGRRIRDVMIYLSPALDYEGLVVDAANQPIAGAQVTLLDAQTGERALAPIAATFVSGADGAFVFHAHDGALLEARHDGFAPGRARLDGPAQSSHHLTIRLAAGDATAAHPARIAGRVIDAAGKPVGAAIVAAEPTAPGDGAGDSAPRAADELRVSGRAETDADGRFALDALDAGAYALTASRDGSAPAHARVAAGATDVTLTLANAASITGVVRDAAGDPVVSFTIVVLEPHGAIREVAVATRSIVDADGRFTIDDLAPGDYRVLASAHGHAPSKERDARADVKPDAIEITLSAGGTLHGTVIDRDSHAPLAYARVSVDDSAGLASIAVPVSESVVTDASGAFTLSGLAPGLRSITVGAYAHHPRIVSGFSVDEGASLGPITVDLRATAPGEEPTLEVVGIGAKLHPDGDALVIDAVLPGGGALDAGLAAGDAILAVDGATCASLGFDASLQHIRGPEGTSVTLTIRKAGASATIDLTVPRRRITN